LDREKELEDRKNKLLEDQLNDIVVGVFAAAEAIRLRNLERQQEERRQLEAERQRQELDRRRRAEAECRNELDTMAALWVKRLRSNDLLCASFGGTFRAVSDVHQSSINIWHRRR
jgi:hypothetical protein